LLLQCIRLSGVLRAECIQ